MLRAALAALLLLVPAAHAAGPSLRLVVEPAQVHAAAGAWCEAKARVENAGDEPASWTIVAEDGEAVFEPASGTLEPGQGVDVAMRARAPSLPGFVGVHVLAQAEGAQARSVLIVDVAYPPPASQAPASWSVLAAAGVAACAVLLLRRRVRDEGHEQNGARR